MKDSASPELSRARGRRAAAEARVRRALGGAQYGGSGGSEPVWVAGRLVLALPAGVSLRGGDLLLGTPPPGGTFASGTRLAEPAAAVAANNELEQASAEADAAASAVRWKLTQAAAAAAEPLDATLTGVTRLDAVALRARYARALRATRPQLTRPGAAITAVGLRHPLLLEALEARSAAALPCLGSHLSLGSEPAGKPCSKPRVSRRERGLIACL